MAIAGIDIGTSGCKVILFDERGNILCSAHGAYKEERKNGFRELNPTAVSNAVFSALKEAASQTASPVNAIAITTLGESVICLNKDGESLCFSMVTGDTRGTEEARHIKKQFSSKIIMEKTGLTPSEMYTLPKLMWMNEHTDVFAKTDKIFFYEDYICYLLTGERKISYSSAARSMAFHIHEMKWDDELLELAGLTCDLFSEPVPSGTIIGNVTPEMAALLHLAPETIVVASGHDQGCAALGSAMLTLSTGEDGHGTCEFLSIMLPDTPDINEMIAQDLPQCPYMLPGKYFTGIETTTCGALMNWARDTIFSDIYQKCQKNGIPFYSYMDKKAATVRTDIMILPQFGSSGNPDINYNVNGCICGLTLHTTPEEIYLALKESLAFQMRYACECAKKTGIKMERIVMTGGGANSPLTAQIRADVFQQPVYRPVCSEAGAMGCMILCAAALGIYPDIASCAQELAKHELAALPNPKQKSYYEEKYQQFKQLYHTMHLFGTHRDKK